MQYRTVRTCKHRIKDDNASQCKAGKFDLRSPPQKKNPEPIVTKIGKSDDVGDPTPVQNFITIQSELFSVSARKYKVIRLAHLLFFFGWTFFFSIAKSLCTICTIDTSNDVASHKDVPFAGPGNKILHFDPIFPKTGNLEPN